MRSTLPTLVRATFILACLAGTAAWSPAYADDDHGSDAAETDHGHDAILKSVREGRLLPLSRIKPKILAKYPGEIVGVTIDKEKGRILYEIRVLRADGHLVEIEVDAATGSVLEVENE